MTFLSSRHGPQSKRKQPLLWRSAASGPGALATKAASCKGVPPPPTPPLLPTTMSATAYDTHQRLRTKAIRQLKKKSYDDAIKTISDGAVSMLEQGEQGSGCDLGVYLVDILDQSGKPCDQDARERLTKIISLAKNDFWRKKVIDTAVRWSVKASRNPAGDSFLRLAIAEVLTKGQWSAQMVLPGAVH